MEEQPEVQDSTSVMGVPTTLEEQLNPETSKPTKLNKNGKPRKQLSPEALERLAKAREKANAIRKQQQVKKLEEKVEKLNTESEPILGKKSDNPKAQEIPTKNLLTEEEPEVEIIKEKPKPKGKKKTKIIVEQSSDDSDEFEPNDNVVFVKRVSRKKKESEEPKVERQQAYQQPPLDPPKPPMKPQLTPQQMQLRDNYNAMFSGSFINQKGMRKYY